MKRTLKILLLIITWIAFPPVYLLLILKNKTLEKRIKIYAYISVIISPFTICIFGILFFVIILHEPSTFSLNTMEETLNINISDDYEEEKNTIDYSGRDYKAIIILKLSDNSFKNVKNQIEKTTFFNLQHDFAANDEIEWQKSDTILYWKVRKYLEKEHLTGYWIKKNDITYDFYSPPLSDIPNSAILFHEAFDIKASFSLKDKTLSYEYIKY